MHASIDCGLATPRHIVYVMSLAILPDPGPRTVTAHGKLAGVTNDKESVLQ